MWRRYADERQGIALGLDIRKELVYEVSYVDDVKTATFPDKIMDELLKIKPRVCGKPRLDKRAKKYIMPFILTKFSEWKREQEIRAIITRKEVQDENYFVDLASNNGVYLEEVVLGSACPISEKEIREIVTGYPHTVIAKRASLING